MQNNRAEKNTRKGDKPRKTQIYHATDVHVDIFYFTYGKSAKYCDHRNYMSVCLFACLFVLLSAGISQKPHVQISPNFLYILPVAGTQSSSNVTSCVLSVV